MVRRFRGLSALAEDLGPVPTHIRWRTTSCSSSLRGLTPADLHQLLHASGAHKPSQAHMHMKIDIFLKSNILGLNFYIMNQETLVIGSIHH